MNAIAAMRFPLAGLTIVGRTAPGGKAKTKRQKWRVSPCINDLVSFAARQFIFAFWFLPFAFCLHATPV